jgi:hypothetical protein
MFLLQNNDNTMAADARGLQVCCFCFLICDLRYYFFVAFSQNYLYFHIFAGVQFLREIDASGASVDRQTSATVSLDIVVL